MLKCYFRVVRFFVLELSVLGLSWKILSRTCPGQIFSSETSPKTLNPSNFLPQTKNSRTLLGQKFSLEKSEIYYKRISVFFLRPGQFQDKFLQDTPRRTTPGQKTSSPVIFKRSMQTFVLLQSLFTNYWEIFFVENCGCVENYC